MVPAHKEAQDLQRGRRMQAQKRGKNEGQEKKERKNGLRGEVNVYVGEK